ncbi:uncharacterized protein LOC115100963 [Rhinatrema bivittatum]|uniref:uncharacterized protein LOC115100963 n=1 Tax=Rhinatrema bivittatum TaxID=194408 RepID=UPI00112B966D|nr:uncharacterized protein LOC115100963 [Rhinatrema bivittatum]
MAGSSRNEHGYFDCRVPPYFGALADAGSFNEGARAACGSAARLTPLSFPGISGHRGRKHRREEEVDDDSPVRKKKVPGVLCSLSPASNSWEPSTSQKMLGEVLNQCSSLPGASLLESPFEEMEQTAWEQQSDVAQRKLKEIEDRLVDEDEVIEVDHNISNLPTLVLSDALKNGLKRELGEDLTKKIVESMKLKNRVAAQTARDRKKARMGELEQQVIELELENQKLLMENKCLLEKACSLVTENQALRQRLGLDALKMEDDKSMVLIQSRTDAINQVAGSAESAALSLRVPLQKVQTQMLPELMSTTWILMALTLQTLSLISCWGFWKAWIQNSSCAVQIPQVSAWRKSSVERSPIPYQPPPLLLWGPHQPSWKPLMN